MSSFVADVASLLLGSCPQPKAPGVQAPVTLGADPRQGRVVVVKLAPLAPEFLEPEPLLRPADLELLDRDA